MNKVTRIERGWAGHFALSRHCLFRRNTLLQCGDVSIVVSTVGGLCYADGERIIELGPDSYFETMAFYPGDGDARYHDADVSRPIYFDSPWSISEIDADDKANEMHEVVVAELTRKIKDGTLMPPS